MNKFIAGWYVLYTRSRHEKKVADQLTEEGMSLYLPVKKELRTWHDRKKYISAPLFESYVFVYLNNIHDYYQGLGARGVLHYVKFGREVARVPENVIDYIRTLTEIDENIEVSSDYFRPGMQLFIKHGPLTGIPCEIIHTDNRKKILVRIHILQRNLLMELHPEYFLTTSD